MTTQTQHINIEVPPKLFDHPAMEKRSYQYKQFTLENLLLFSLPFNCTNIIESS